MFLIRERDAARSHYDTVWTLSIILGLFKCAVVWLAAPLVAAYFEEPRVELVVQVLAFGPLIIGFSNVGTVDFRKHLRFEKDFVLNIPPKIISFFLGVGAAFLLQNYWALVIAILVGNVALVLNSFIMSDYRPRLTLEKVGSIFHFSIAVMIEAVGRYFNRTLGSVVAGRMANTQQFGAFHVAFELSLLVSVELIVPLSRALFPNVASQKADPEEFKKGSRL